MSKKVQYKGKVSNKLLIPVILMMGVIPLIVHAYQYDANLSQFDWFPYGADSKVDFFLGWKMIAIIIVGIVMAGILLYRYSKNKEKLRFENSFYCLFFYGLFVIMSALFSDYKYWVMHGTYELFEPVWVVMIYILLCYFTYNYVQKEKQVKTILSVAGIGMSIVTLIGVFQFFKLDFFKTNLGKHLITNPSSWDNLDKLSFNFGIGTSYTTLYNPNFLSFYFGMLVPLIVCLFIAAKKGWQKILLVVAEGLCLICLKGSESDSGWMAIAACIVILVLVLSSRKKKLFIATSSLIIVGGILALGFGTKTSIGEQIKTTIMGTSYLDEVVPLRSFITNDDNVELNIDNNLLYVSYEVDDSGEIQFECEDSAGNNLETPLANAEKNIYVFVDDRFDPVTVQPIQLDLGNNSSIPALTISVAGTEWSFAHLENQGYYFCNYAGKLVKWKENARSHLFKDDAMNDRGHIWDMVIPLLRKHVIMGAGANTFMFEYPQDDYIGQKYLYDNGYEVKAHCWYLQQWVETGLLGTLALLAFLIWYFVQSIRIYRHVDLHESIAWVGFGFFAAVLVYVIVSVANDSNVCTAPMFWGMLGLGLSVNRMLAEKNGMFTKNTEDEMKKETIINGNQQIQSELNSKMGKGTKKSSSKKMSRKQRKKQR